MEESFCGGKKGWSFSLLTVQKYEISAEKDKERYEYDRLAYMNTVVIPPSSSEESDSSDSSFD